MREFNVGYKLRMRELTLGPSIPQGIWALTFADGSTYAAIYFDGVEQKPDAIIAWAVATREIDYDWVLGCYTDPAHRGKGAGSAVTSTLLTNLLDSGLLEEGSQLFASTWRWSKYAKIGKALGLDIIPWE